MMVNIDLSQIRIRNKMNKQLLFSVTKKDLDITYYSGTGAGGQHRNKCKNCVRIKHIETGIITTGQEERSLRQNLKNAFNRLVNNKEFKKWIKIKASEINGDIVRIQEEVKRKVDKWTDEKYLKIEYYDPGDVETI